MSSPTKLRHLNILRHLKSAIRLVESTCYGFSGEHELATEMLDILRDGPTDLHDDVVNPLATAAEETAHLRGHDLSGRLFHTLLTDAKFTGAYYTAVSSATLLARLVFHGWPAGVDWADHELPASLNVADLACGTGTLLMAVAAEAERLHKNAGGRQTGQLHKAMVEQALHGYDVQLSAVHFAATTLAMLNPDIQFDRMNLYVMPLGATGGNISLGSLDFLGEENVPVQFALSPDLDQRNAPSATRVSGSGAAGAAEGVTATLPNLDLAIMNPPFTRSVGGNLLFGGLPKRERRELQTELSNRMASRYGTATSGLGAAFVAAASPRLRPGEGRLALVLPITVCTGPSWTQTRALIGGDYSLDIIVTSHDPKRWNFSDSTDLSEALLVATRRREDAARGARRTTFVNLWRNPTDVIGAHRLAEAITSTGPAELEGDGTALLTIDDRHVGEVLSVAASERLGEKWFGVQFSRADVLRSAHRLVVDGTVSMPGGLEAAVPLCRLSELGEVGPDRRRLVDAFDRTTSITAFPMVEGHESDERRRMVCAPNCHLSPLVRPRGGQRAGYSNLLWRMAARLIVAERLWLNTARVVAMWCERRVLGDVWWPVRLQTESWEKMLCVWLNSSLGVLSMLTYRNSTRGGWVATKKADLENLPVLDVRTLTEAQRAGLLNLFEQVVTTDFERLPAMENCAGRRALDEGISEILNLPELGSLRALLASEPVVSNERL